MRCRLFDRRADAFDARADSPTRCVMRRFLSHLAPVILLWLLFSWPLPRYLFSGIPSSSAHEVEKNHAREMIAGDHLQLLYHFWLAHDMIRGKTPLFYNLYEFNEFTSTDDESQFEPGAYFAPFSLFYAIAASIGGRAFGWNFAAFVSLALTFSFTVFLLRRYEKDPWIASAIALISIALPYRWAALMGGSPTGFACAWIPLLFLGLDIAVRENRMAGGVLACVAVILSCITDSHTLFFGVLMIPCWCLVAVFGRDRFAWTQRRDYVAIARALFPLFLSLLFILMYSVVFTRTLATSTVAGGRSLSEVALFAPRSAGVFGWEQSSRDGQIYFGWTVAAVLVSGWFLALIRSVRNPGARRRQWIALSVVLAAATCVVLLAIGPNGPLKGRLFYACRRLIPQYDMVRQTAKIYLVLPTLLAAAAGLVWKAIPLENRAVRRSSALVFALLAIAEYRCQVGVSVALLQNEQAAYRAVAEHAAAQGRPARAMAITLWPGDTHWSSIYQYYASLYRIRMMNGYRPLVPSGYVGNVFRRFESVNLGGLTSNQLQDLSSRGVNYLLLHEDVFPEEVSPYPVAFTLKRLLNHPRLSLLKQDNRVWAFRITEEPAVRPEQGAKWRTFCSARQWELEKVKAPNSDIRQDTQASGGAYVSLCSKDAFVESGHASTCDAPSQRWLIRIRGAGIITLDVMVDGRGAQQRELSVDSGIWTWKELPVPTLGKYSQIAFRAGWKTGHVDLDTAILASGEWMPLSPGESVTLPAPCFFHAGFTDLDRDIVALRSDYDPDAIVFYGPKLPFEAGEYDVEMHTSSAVAPGTVLGQFNMRWTGREDTGWVPVVAGASVTRYHFAQEQNLPLFLAFLFLRNADMEIHKVVFHRLR